MTDFDVVDALAGFAEDLKSEAAFAERLHAAVLKMKQERDEARAENERLREACTLALRIMEQENKVQINTTPLMKFVTVIFAPEDVAVLRAALGKKP